MPVYETRKLNVRIGSLQWRIRALKNRDQFSDPDGAAERAGICSASWSLFGQLWPASQVLAKAAKRLDITDRRILELGCGLGLPSLVLQARGANVTASDHHPLSEPFLDYNAELNQLSPIPYLDLPWSSRPQEVGGQFDVIIGSDILYERNHASMLAELIQHLAAVKAKILITCPGRGHRNQFSRLLQKLGFELTATKTAFTEDEQPPYRGQLLCYRRGF
ncbi:MAG: hypothetical protein WC965_13645 [Thiohalomonadaceae bacterium]